MGFWFSMCVTGITATKDVGPFHRRHQYIMWYKNVCTLRNGESSGGKGTVAVIISANGAHKEKS